LVVTTWTQKSLVFFVLPLFGVLLGVGLFWASQKYLPGKSLEGRRVVISLTRQILGRDPSPEELEKGLALWRQSPDAFYRAAEQYLTKDESGYGVSLVDQNGRVISKRSGPLKLVLDPFTIYTNWPNQHTIRFNIDGHGFRATPGNEGKPRIVVLGASVAFGHLLPSDEVTFPWLLAQRLTDFHVLNAGVAGYLSGQELALMVHRLDEFRPVAYLLFDGWNELFDQDLVVRRAPQLFGFNNQFFEMQNRLHDYHVMAGGPVGRVSEQAALPSPSSDEDTYLRALRTAYVTNISRMHSFAAARGARFLVVFQPELGNKRFRTEQEQMSLEAMNTAHKYLDRKFPAKYAAMVREAKSFCQTAGIQYLDIQQEPELRDQRQTIFYDAAHLNEPGQMIVADILERRLRSLLQGAGAPPATSTR
jgi:hypothetical protein